MKKSSKRYKILSSALQPIKYQYKDAINLLTFISTAKFLESFESHIYLNLNTKYSNQQLKSSLFLPNNISKTGKPKTIAVITQDKSLINELCKLGVTLSGSDIVLNMISNGFTPFDILISSPDDMFLLTKYGKFLGPKGLMPSQKLGTVSSNILETVKDFLGGKLECKTDKFGVVHTCFGNSLMAKESLEENLLYTYEFVLKNKPVGAKGHYLKSFFICSTMSPSIEIDIASFSYKASTK